MSPRSTSCTQSYIPEHRCIFPASTIRGYAKPPDQSALDQQVADLKAGRGMGLALAAELNGYPGPMHVLELSEKLGLTMEQRVSVQRLFD